MARVMKDVSSSKDLEGMTMSNGVNGVDGTNLTNGVSKGIGEKSVEEGGIKVPDTVVKEGIRVVKKEMEKVAEVVVDDE